MTVRRKPLQGDEDVLFVTLSDDVVRIVRRLVNTDPETIDDACQYAWLQLLRCQPRRDTIRAWLITVARREAIRLDQIRRRCDALNTGECEAGTRREPVADIEAYTGCDRSR